jgi:hypothetical protein
MHFGVILVPLIHLDSPLPHSEHKRFFFDLPINISFKLFFGVKDIKGLLKIE